jgi:hypothetical protein
VASGRLWCRCCRQWILPFAWTARRAISFGRLEGLWLLATVGDGMDSGHRVPSSGRLSTRVWFTPSVEAASARTSSQRKMYGRDTPAFERMGRSRCVARVQRSETHRQSDSADGTRARLSLAANAEGRHGPAEAALGSDVEAESSRSRLRLVAAAVQRSLQVMPITTRCEFLLRDGRAVWAILAESRVPRSLVGPRLHVRLYPLRRRPAVAAREPCTRSLECPKSRVPLNEFHGERRLWRRGQSRSHCARWCAFPPRRAPVATATATNGNAARVRRGAGWVCAEGASPTARTRREERNGSDFHRAVELTTASPRGARRGGGVAERLARGSV